jgi:hypothetical protein
MSSLENISRKGIGETVFNREKAIEKINQKIARLLAFYTEEIQKVSTPLAKLKFSSDIKDLEELQIILESKEVLDEDLKRILKAIENLNSPINSNKSSDSKAKPETLKQIITDLNQNLNRLNVEVDDSKFELLQRIRNLFPISKQNFGFQTNSTPRIIPNGGNSEIETLNLQETYLENFLEILSHFGYNSDNLETYTGSYDTNTIRTNPYTFVNLSGQNVILAESFVKGNSLFIFDLKQLRNNPNLPFNSTSTFVEIATYLNSLTKDQLNFEGVYKIDHKGNYTTNALKKIEEISKATQTILNQSQSTNEERLASLKSEKLTPEQWRDEFKKFAELYPERDEKTGLLLRQPSQTSKDPWEKSLGLKLQDIRSGKSFLNTEKLKALGFRLEKTREILKPKEWLVEFEKFAELHPERDEKTGLLLRQPSSSSKDPWEKSLGLKLKDIISGRSFLDTEKLKALGFRVEKVNNTSEEWLAEFEKFAELYPERSEETGLLLKQPSQTSKDPWEKSLGLKLRDIISGKSFSDTKKLKALGFRVEKIN